MKLLIEKGADSPPYRDKFGRYGSYALQAWKGHVEVVKLLIEKGAEVRPYQ